ncbi:MAG: hypothetical protein HGA27_08385 [Peptococcaceae bacterium]|nr:hypothetical protein [Peptococcaceae bacterium]
MEVDYTVVVAQEQYDHYSLPQDKSPSKRRIKERRFSGKGKHSLSILVLMFFGTGMLIAYYYSQVVVSGYEIAQLNNQITVIQQETDSLSGAVDSFDTLGRVEYIAVNKLKMVKPASSDIVVVKSSLAVSASQNNTSTDNNVKQGNAGQEAKSYVAERSSKVLQAFVNLLGMKGS